MPDDNNPNRGIDADLPDIYWSLGGAKLESYALTTLGFKVYGSGFRV